MLPKYVLIPIIAGLLTQLIKFIIEAVRGEFRWQSLHEYGGMPSSHTAFVTSLATVIAYSESIYSPQFAISVIFAILIVRDAIGLRQFMGQHAKYINMLVKELPDPEEKKFPQNLVERIGHTPWQATVGGALGILIALVLLNIW